MGLSGQRDKSRGHIQAASGTPDHCGAHHRKLIGYLGLLHLLWTHHRQQIRYLSWGYLGNGANRGGTRTRSFSTNCNWTAGCCSVSFLIVISAKHAQVTLPHLSKDGTRREMIRVCTNWCKNEWVSCTSAANGNVNAAPDRRHIRRKTLPSIATASFHSSRKCHGPVESHVGHRQPKLRLDTQWTPHHDAQGICTHVVN